jgi:D-alanine--poly(phosphoribitol) ligase subunit 2
MAVTTNTADRVLRTLERVTQTDEVRRDVDLQLYETGVLDSLGTVELILALGEEFGIDLSPAEVDRAQWATPSLLIAFMESRVAG